MLFGPLRMRKLIVVVLEVEGRWCGSDGARGGSGGEDGEFVNF